MPESAVASKWPPTTAWCNLVPLSYALSPLKPGSRSFKLANMKRESNSCWYSDRWGLKKDLPPNLVTQWSNILSQRSVPLTLTMQPISVTPSFHSTTSKLLLGWDIDLWRGSVNHWSAVGSSFSFNSKGGTAELLGIKRASRISGKLHSRSAVVMGPQRDNGLSLGVMPGYVWAMAKPHEGPCLESRCHPEVIQSSSDLNF